MKFTQRIISTEADLQTMTDLVNRFPVENLHVADLPYRFSSWAVDHPENMSLWTDENNKLVGWAVMQTPFWTIDYTYDPTIGKDLHPQILCWVDERAKEIVDTSSGRPIWFINVFTTQGDRIQDLEAVGFASQADVGENSWTKVLMKRPGSMAVDDSTLPDGFVIQPLGDKSDAYVDLHRDVFQSNSMTPEWRRRTLERPEYVADLDLVAADPDGRWASFCVCWLNQAGTEISGQIEPLGVHEDFRKLGLGRSLLLEGIRRLQEHGAESIYVETDNYRDEAFILYESVGFAVAHDVLVYRKDYGEL